MAYHQEKTAQGSDTVFDGWEKGIAPSPLKGIANIQNANISTETGEVMASFARYKQDQAAITNGTLTASVSDGAVLLDAPATLQAGQWITVSASTIPSATASADYLIVGGGGGGGGAVASEASGGGGAGGLVASSFTPTVGSYTVTVGDGGAGGATGVVGTDGGFSAISNSVSFDYLIVGGGGGGGGIPIDAGIVVAGSGGGGQVAAATVSKDAGVYTITVGAGGAGGVGNAAGSSGGTSSLFGVSAVGGGGGGVNGGNGQSGASGGSGGAGSTTGGAATAGFAGGNGATDVAGGGGGSGSVGANGVASTSAGNGGSGTSSSITGASVSYGGGAGGSTALSSGAGTGSGGGANGVASGSGESDGNAGTANRGGGGSGAAGAGVGAPHNGGAGGSGVVILRFLTSAISYIQKNGTVTTDGSYTVITWNSSGSFAFGSVNVSPGGGGGGSPSVANGALGGSGGGGASGTTTTGGSSYTGRGNDGGTGYEAATQESGGGGGGASAVGGNAAADVGGVGGDGTASSISGTSVTYAGGGGGGSDGAPGLGGTGGGGRGTSGSDLSLSHGTDGLGGGGGGNFGAQSGGDGGSGIVIISYTTGTMTATGGIITFSGGKTIHTFYSSDTFTVQSIAAAGQYFVSYKDSSNKVKLSSIFDPYGLYPIVHGTSGTATFSTLAVPSAGVAKATEAYNSATANYYRYYILDANSRTWVYDTQVYATTLAANGIGEAWMLPDPTDYSANVFTGLAILNGWVVQINNTHIWGKPVTDLGRAFAKLKLNDIELRLCTQFPTHNNPAFVGSQGKLYYGDRNYVGQVYPISSLASGLANVQSSCSFTASGTTGTLTSVISGSSPYLQNSSGTMQRVPIVFYSTETTGVPVGITEGTVYYIVMSNSVDRTFTVYTASTGGSALTITTISTSYFNTFYPLGAQTNTASVHVPLFTFTQQRLNLPVFEEVQCFVEVGNVCLIGCRTNSLYPWNQVDALPSDIIALPEADVKTMTNVNNMAYIFAGNRGNVYISNGASASRILKVPDYCAGVPGSAQTYIEPIFTWGDSAYVRGRVYFSILDQTSTKVGNCGGVWSFVPPQNFSYSEESTLALRLENQNSYGTYNGVATLIIPAAEQDVISPQFWTSWQNSYSLAVSSAFGIDQTDDIPVTTYIVETDIVPVGTYLNRKTFQQTEYKLTSPLVSGDSIALYWRVNRTDSWTAFGTQVNDGSNIISGYQDQNFQASQWLQLRVVITTNGASNSSFVPMSELRIR